MSKQRYINTRFWDDNYIVTLDPLEKLLFLYLITNPLTEISGAYEIPLRRIAFDTGIDREMVLKIFDRFADADRIIYRDGWILICNFIKHQSNNPKIVKGIETSVSRCPDWIKDRLSVAYQELSHLNSNTNTNSNTNSGEAARDVWSGRRGITRNHIPVNASSDLETWLSAVASTVGVRDADSLASRRKWEDVCIALIKEGRDLTSFLRVVEMERNRLSDKLHFFSPDGCLKIMQMKGMSSTVSRPNRPTGRELAAEADRMELEALSQ